MDSTNRYYDHYMQTLEDSYCALFLLKSDKVKDVLVGAIRHKYSDKVVVYLTHAQHPRARASKRVIKFKTGYQTMTYVQFQNSYANNHEGLEFVLTASDIDQCDEVNYLPEEALQPFECIIAGTSRYYNIETAMGFWGDIGDAGTIVWDAEEEEFYRSVQEKYCYIRAIGNLDKLIQEFELASTRFEHLPAVSAALARIDQYSDFHTIYHVLKNHVSDDMRSILVLYTPDDSSEEVCLNYWYELFLSVFPAHVSEIKITLRDIASEVVLPNEKFDVIVVDRTVCFLTEPQEIFDTYSKYLSNNESSQVILDVLNTETIIPSGYLDASAIQIDVPYRGEVTTHCVRVIPYDLLVRDIHAAWLELLNYDKHPTRNMQTEWVDGFFVRATKFRAEEEVYCSRFVC